MYERTRWIFKMVAISFDLLLFVRIFSHSYAEYIEPDIQFEYSMGAAAFPADSNTIHDIYMNGLKPNGS